MYQNISKLWATGAMLTIAAAAPAAFAQVSAVKPLTTTGPSTGVKYFPPDPVQPASAPVQAVQGVRGNPVVPAGLKPSTGVKYFPPVPVKPSTPVQGQPVGR